MNCEWPSNSLRQAGARILFSLFLAGLIGCSGSVTSRTEIDVNGHRKVSQVVNGVKRTLETRHAVVFQDGQIAQLPPGAVIQLSERKGGKTIMAEVRENNGQPELWMKAQETFRKGTPADQAWLEEFLQALGLDDRKKR
jgi:hypothetical protein